MINYRVLDRCLACGSESLRSYLDLGNQPLANSCHPADELPSEFPLGVNVCLSCWHSQLPVAVNPDLLFKSYLYVSGTTKTLSRYFSDFVRKVEADFGAGKTLRVLDIASNDGSLLEKFKARGHFVQGVDPAENLAPLSRERGVSTIIDFWSERAFKQLTSQFDVIIAMNVVAHVADPASFLALCRNALAPNGRIYVQTSQAYMVKNGEFDTVYHEHHSFFSVNSFIALAHRTGLKIANIAYVPVHGTSYLVELIPAVNDIKQLPDDFEIGRTEIQWGYYDPATYTQFTDRALANVARVRTLVEWHRKAGYRVIGYGVAAKGMTFANFARLDFEYIIDDNPLKIGLLTPGGNARITALDVLNTEVGNILYVILAWNFHSEIVERIRSKRKNSQDAFLSYFPSVSLISFP